MLYDIRDANKAACTLESITGVSLDVWLSEARRNDCADDDKDIGKIITENYGHIPRVNDLEMIITHVTTSGNGCESILKDGIIELKSAYQKSDSELRNFLESKGIDIQLDSNCLTYNGNRYDISYDNRSKSYEPEKKAAQSVGWRFYKDFTVCGFFSINCKRPYLGYVHRRPEILVNLDNLLKTDLQVDWMQSHQAYEIVFKAPFRDIVYGGWDDDTEEEKMMLYLTYAYLCVSMGPDTKEVLCKNGVRISPDQILECNRFTAWDCKETD